jgi:dienelactone hydrolase
MAAVILPGGGGRYGPGRLWRRLARVLADGGVVTLRIDYPELRDGGGAWAAEGRYAAVAEAVDWFAGRTGGLGLLLVGYCYGTRVIVRRARNWEGVVGAALINPHFRRASRQSFPARAARRLVFPVATWIGRLRRRWRSDPTTRLARRLDRRMTDLLAVAAGRFPVWILVGERGSAAADVHDVVRSVASRGVPVHVEFVPGMVLIPDVGPEPFNELIERVSAWAIRSIGEASLKEVAV